MEAVVRTLVRDPRRARVLGGVAATPSLRRHRKRMMGRLTAVLESARLVHGVELEPDPLAQITPAFVVGGTAEAVLAFLDGTAKLTLEELVAELTTLWLLTGNGAAQVARHRLR